MSMYTLNGIVQNVFTKAATVDKETGEQRPATENVQILGENVLQNGEKKFEMVTLKVQAGDAYRKLQGKFVRVPVGMFVKDGQALWYALKTETQPITS